APGRRAYEGYVTPGRLRPARGRRGGYAVQRLRPYGPYGPYEGRNRQQRQQTQKDHLITGCQEGGRTRGPRQQTSRPSSFSSSFLQQGSQRPIPRSFFSTSADTATATATANALVATVPLLLLLSLSNALFHPIFSAAFFVLWSSVLFFPPSSSYGRPYGLQRRQEQGQDQGRGIQQFLNQFEERVLDRRIRTVGYYEKLRRHEARRPKTKDTIDWLEKHAFFCRTRPEGLVGSRDAGPATAGPRPPYVTEAERHNNVGGGYAVQRLRPYGPYGPYEGRNGHVTPGRLRPARGRRTSQRLYVTAAERHNNVGGGYAVQRLRPYGPYEGRNV
ncbi:hypothetical protein L249_6036, partial [Ophiocordyceps polyrhachis-furcata BCC 54312]